MPHAKTLAVVLAWLIALAMVCALWQHFTSADAFARAPTWFLNLSERLGSVVYADPQLALRIRLSRLAVLITAAALLAVGIIERRWVGTALRELFLTKTHPLNLAVFRMVVGWQVYEVGRWLSGTLPHSPPRCNTLLKPESRAGALSPPSLTGRRTLRRHGSSLGA